MIKSVPSPNFDDRKGRVDMLVIHYTGRPTFEESLEWLTSPEKKVSAHYLIGEGGEILQLVEDEKRAWHAGVSHWAGVSDINSCSIGIELQNPGHAFGYNDFPDAQTAALIELCHEILKRHGIPAGRVLGHSDVAPMRKPDPGEKFPWATLAAKGVGRWPQKGQGGEIIDPRQAFIQFGYDPNAPLEDIVTAFQRHWYPENVTGKACPETLKRLTALL